MINQTAKLSGKSSDVRIESLLLMIIILIITKKPWHLAYPCVCLSDWSQLISSQHLVSNVNANFLFCQLSEICHLLHHALLNHHLSKYPKMNIFYNIKYCFHIWERFIVFHIRISLPNNVLLHHNLQDLCCSSLTKNMVWAWFSDSIKQLNSALSDTLVW